MRPGGRQRQDDGASGRLTRRLLIHLGIDFHGMDILLSQVSSGVMTGI
jgi:hypothetical protein